MNFKFNFIYPGRLKALIFIFLTFIAGHVYSEWQSEDAVIMGTTIRVEVWHSDAKVRAQGVAKVFGEMERVNRLMSPYIKESQLSKINACAHERPVEVDSDLFQLIQKSTEVSELTGGAFDITYASVGRLFNYRKQIKPDDEEVNKAKRFISYKNVILDKDQLTVSFAKRGVKIDLGGIAKGFAVDQAIQHLKSIGIKHALVSAGGDTRVLGDRRGRPWLVGIRDPANNDEVITLLPLQDEALSTSGDYERFFIEDGVIYHHIIHSSTGKSASEVRSVSIIGADTTTTDALSTSVFVLGIKAGLNLLNDLDGIEGVIVDHQSKLYYSEGLKQEGETVDTK